MADYSLKRERDDPYGAAEDPSKRQHTAVAGQETVFRLLVPARKVTNVIGKGGANLKQLRDETGCKLRVCDPVPTCDDRVMIIAAPEGPPEVPENHSQVALYRVHERLLEPSEGQLQSALPVNHVTRLLVCHTQAGCLIGKGGGIIKEIRDTSGAVIKILTEHELPLCALHNDRVVQIMGDQASVLRALAQVSRQIRENPPKERPGGANVSLMALLQGPQAAPWGAPPPGYHAR